MDWGLILSNLLFFWYALLFPTTCLFNPTNREVSVTYSLLILFNLYVFDVIGVASNVWWITQAYFDLLFVVASLLIRNKYVMYAAIILCGHSFMINMVEHLSEKQSVFYSLWEYINLLTLDLLALCLIIDNKLNKQNIGATE